MSRTSTGNRRRGSRAEGAGPSQTWRAVSGRWARSGAACLPPLLPYRPQVLCELSVRDKVVRAAAPRGLDRLLVNGVLEVMAGAGTPQGNQGHVRVVPVLSGMPSVTGPIAEVVALEGRLEPREAVRIGFRRCDLAPALVPDFPAELS